MSSRSQLTKTSIGCVKQETNLLITPIGQHSFLVIMLWAYSVSLVMEGEYKGVTHFHTISAAVVKPTPYHAHQHHIPICAVLPWGASSSLSSSSSHMTFDTASDTSGYVPYGPSPHSPALSLITQQETLPVSHQLGPVHFASLSVSLSLFLWGKMKIEWGREIRGKK